MCLHTKASHQPPVRELNPLPVPDAPWDTISVDFIVELPESEGKDAIMIVVDSVTKCGHFVDTVTTPSAAGTANIRKNGFGPGETQVALGNFYSPKEYLALWAAQVSLGVSGCL